MGWQQRPYAGEDDGRRVYRRSSYGGSGMGALSITTMIIIANAVVALLMLSRSSLGAWLAVWGWMQAEAVLHGEIWRLFTATYLHAGFAHLFVNMLGLYFFGPALERAWGPRQFFLVYTLGGVVGNVVLTLAGLVGFIHPQTIGVGASGSVLAMLGAAAVLFPNAQVYVYFLFPLRIRTFVLLYGIYFVYNIVRQGSNYGGDLCHAGGLIVGLWWAYSGGISLSGRHRVRAHPGSLLKSLFTGGTPRPGSGSWEQRTRQRQADAETIDRILAKVHEQGVQSLTPAERRALAEAGERRRAEEAELRRRDRQ